MITLTAIGAGETTRNPVNQSVFVNRKFNHMIKIAAMFRKDFIERLGLSLCARVSIKNSARCIIHRGKLGIDHGRDDCVRHKSAGIHHIGNLAAKVGIGLARLSQHVAGRQLQHAVAFLKIASLCAFASARRSKKYDVHCQFCPQFCAFSRFHART